MEKFSNTHGQIYNHRADFTMKVMNFVGLAFAVTAAGTWLAPFILPANFPYFLIFIAELALVFTARIWAQWARPGNILMFCGFAFLSGLTLFPLLNYALQIGGHQLIFQALFATVALAFSAGIYARTTSRDLSGIGGFLMIALIGLIIVGILQIFWFSSIVEMIAAGVGVVLFSAFIAYDIQMLERFPRDRAIEAAIGLYLSIFNLFTSVLRLLIALRD